jgi:hypothetical protein
MSSDIEAQRKIARAYVRMKLKQSGKYHGEALVEKLVAEVEKKLPLPWFEEVTDKATIEQLDEALLNKLKRHPDGKTE